MTTARAGYYPSVSLSGSYGNEITSNPTTRLANDDNDPLLFNALGIEIRQNLFNGWSTDNSVDSAIMARDSVAFAMNSTVQTVMLQGITAYFQILRLNELIRVSRARERTIGEQLELETARVERGAGIEVDVLQAKSRLQIAIEQRVDLEGQLRQAEGAYIQAFQRRPDITRMRLDPAPLDVLPPTLDDALYMARDENPLVRAREFLSRSARFTIDATRAGYFPTLDAVARYDHENNVSHVRDDARTSALLIEMSWDLFSGFATDAAVSSAQESLLESFATADRTLHQVELQVRTAWIKLENTRQRKELLLNAVAIAQEVFVARQRLREAGRETTPNVLDAESEVFQAESNLIRADYDARIAIYELVAAMGILTPALLGIDVAVIEDIDQYFSAEDQVRDLAPIEEVEARRREIERMRVEGQRDSLIPAPGLISTGAPTEDLLVDPSPTSPDSEEGDSVISPPPEEESSFDPDDEIPFGEDFEPFDDAGEVEEEILEESRAPAVSQVSVASDTTALTTRRENAPTASAFDVEESSLPLSDSPTASIQSDAAPVEQSESVAVAMEELGSDAVRSTAHPKPVQQAAVEPLGDFDVIDPSDSAEQSIAQPEEQGDFIAGVRRLLGLDQDEATPDTLAVSEAPRDGQALALSDEQPTASDSLTVREPETPPAPSDNTLAELPANTVQPAAAEEQPVQPDDGAALAEAGTPNEPAEPIAVVAEPAEEVVIGPAEIEIANAADPGQAVVAAQALADSDPPAAARTPEPILPSDPVQAQPSLIRETIVQTDSPETPAADAIAATEESDTVETAPVLAATPREENLHPDASASVQGDLVREQIAVVPEVPQVPAEGAAVPEQAQEPLDHEAAEESTAPERTSIAALPEAPVVPPSDALPSPVPQPQHRAVEPSEAAPAPVRSAAPVPAAELLPAPAPAPDPSPAPVAALPLPAPAPQPVPAPQAAPAPLPTPFPAPTASEQEASYPLTSASGGVAVDGAVLTIRSDGQAGFEVPGMTLFGEAPSQSPFPR